jgi:hypothetical protein
MAGLVIGGMPTDVDVEMLRKEIGVPEPGTMVLYERVEAILRIPRKKSRFLTVVMAWRRRLSRENNVELKAVPNEGYKVLDNPGRIDASGRLYKGSLRRMGRAGNLAVRTGDSGLDEQGRRTRDHIVKVTAQLRQAAGTAAKELRYPDPQVQRLGAPQG